MAVEPNQAETYVLVRPGKPVEQMTDDEIYALADRLSDATNARRAEAGGSATGALPGRTERSQVPAYTTAPSARNTLFSCTELLVSNEKGTAMASGCRDCSACTRSSMWKMMVLMAWTWYGWLFTMWLKRCPQCKHGLSRHARRADGSFKD